MVQHLIASGRTITELARRMEVTQQAMSKIVAELIRLGILETASAGAERIERICLSERGRQWVQLGQQTRARIEARLFEIMKVPS
jgi:DNA-binding MarR family transcriptional regulator